MIKKRKLRTLGAFKNENPLPTPEEVNTLVKSVTETSVSTEKKEMPKTTTSKPKTTPTSTSPKPNSSKKIGRPPLKIPRVKYTTSLTEENKTQVQLYAIKKNVRQADILNDIIEAFFKKRGKTII